MDWVAVSQQLSRDLLAIELVKSALYAQGKNIRLVPLLDSGSGKPISKTEFKDLASAGLIIDQVGAEVLISLVANAIETFSIRVETYFGVKWEPFKNPFDSIPYAERGRQFRAINNVFKHQEGYINCSGSRSARFLVENAYFKDETYLKHLGADEIIPDIELAIYEVFAHMYDVCNHLANLPYLGAGKFGVSLIGFLKERVVYEIIRNKLLVGDDGG